MKDKEKNTCRCCDDCTGTPDCDCGCENCHCAEGGCHCGDDCQCGNDCHCDDNHKCHDDCHCGDQHEGCECGHECNCAHETNLDYKDLYLRTMADFDNYRRRSMGAISDARTDGKVDALNTILPAMDTFRQATSMITDKNTLIGVQYIEKNILNALTSLGVTKIDASGQFDPELHCAVSTDSESDVPAGTIVKVLADGYKLGDKVIRYSQVIVKK